MPTIRDDEAVNWKGSFVPTMQRIERKLDILLDILLEDGEELELEEFTELATLEAECRIPVSALHVHLHTHGGDE